MGRGVYSSDFQGTGGTFLVSGTLCRQEDYEAYLQDARQTPEAIVSSVEDTNDPADMPMGYEAWSQQEIDDQYENLTSTIQTVAAAFPGLIEAASGVLRNNRAGFDSEFIMLLDAGPVQLGLRGWEHDYVVGAGADHSHKYDSPQDMIANPEAYAKELLDDGYIASDYADRAKALSEDLLAYVRLELQDNGFECRFRTSGWTTSTYSKAEHPATEKTTLAERIRGNLAYFNSPHPLDDLVTTREGRIALTKQLLSILSDDENYGSVQLEVPLYHPDGQVTLFDPFEASKYEDAESIASVSITPEQLQAAFPDGLPDTPGVMTPIPCNTATEDWWSAQQIASRSVLLSAEEFEAATGQAIILTIADEDLEDDQRPRP